MNPPNNQPMRSGSGEFDTAIENIFAASPNANVSISNIEERRDAFQHFFESQLEGND